MSAPKPNAELAYRVLDHIDAHPEQWYQGSWVTDCGTSFCFAGWALTLTGHTLVDHEVDGWRRMRLDGSDEVYSSTVSLAAARELSLSHWAVEDLFEGTNTREDLGRLVDEIFGPRPRPWTPDEKTETGTRIYVKRACNGCGELLGDVTEAEMDRAVAGLPAEDVTAECPRCRPAGDAS